MATVSTARRARPRALHLPGRVGAVGVLLVCYLARRGSTEACSWSVRQAASAIMASTRRALAIDKGIA
jgi:hypothetical protein